MTDGRCWWGGLEWGGVQRVAHGARCSLDGPTEDCAKTRTGWQIVACFGQVLGFVDVVHHLAGTSFSGKQKGKQRVPSTLRFRKFPGKTEGVWCSILETREFP